MRVLVALAVLLVGTASALDARAQMDDQPLPGDATAGLDPEFDRTYRGLWWGGIGVYSGDATPDAEPPAPEPPATNATVLTFRAGGSYVLPSVPVGFEARVGLAAFFWSPEELDTESTLRWMNPLLAAFWAPRFGRFDLRAGLGLALPLASLRTTGDLGADGLLDASAYAFAAATEGMWDLWAWSPDRFTLLLPSATIDGCPIPHLCVGGALGIHFMFSTASDETTVGGVTVTRETSDDTVLQLGGDIAYKSRSTRTGVRLRLVTELSGGEGDEDNSQISLEPYLLFDVGDGFFELAFTINLDEPFGFSFGTEPYDVWGLHVKGGSRF